MNRYDSNEVLWAMDFPGEGVSPDSYQSSRRMHFLLKIPICYKMLMSLLREPNNLYLCRGETKIERARNRALLVEFCFC